MKRNGGLREQIVGATSEEEVAALLKTGQSYEFASARTIRGWKRSANKKFGTFAAPQLVVPKDTPARKTKVKRNIKTEKAEATA
jgi:hypothetical protein